MCVCLYIIFILSQPSDGTCPCKSGFDDYGRGMEDCVPHIYPNCPEETYRSQDGTCFSASEWESYCSSEVNHLQLHTSYKFSSSHSVLVIVACHI